MPDLKAEEVLSVSDPHPLLRAHGALSANVKYVEEHDPRKALEFLRERLLIFLTNRFAARRSDVSTTPGLPFRVVTRTPGLRVHYSPAYFFNAWGIFGAPTPTVHGWIQPGRYRFGVMGAGWAEPSFDRADFDVPGLSEAQLNF
jgi:hypothetical protein